MAKYHISTHIAIEHFEECSLVLLVAERRIIELDLFEAEILKCLEKGLSNEELFTQLKNHNECPQTFSKHKLSEILFELSKNQVLVTNNEDVFDITGGAIMKNVQYLRDPDVVIREEDPEEGAILFHPDTNQVKVINASGYFIWQQCDKPATKETITKKIQDTFEEVPPKEVANDVSEFLDEMVATGFVGTVTPYKPES